ncbi:hypothetical protein ACVWXL_005470 [Bradyrhizobium sp. GM22.5]
MAPAVLPNNTAIFGRASKRDSHYLYSTSLASKVDRAALQFKDPISKSMLLEVRIGGGDRGAQTVFPGSVHESGEPIEWEVDCEPAQVDDDELLRKAEQLAALCLLARYWPPKPKPNESGGRHDAALTVGGFLARCGFKLAQVKLCVERVAKAANDEEVRDRVQAAHDAVLAYEKGEKTRGYPKLKETFGEKVANKVAEWLRYTDDDARAAGPHVNEDGTAKTDEEATQTESPPEGVALQDFVAVMSNGRYLFCPTREMWPGKSVDACVPPVPLTDSNGVPLLNPITKKPIAIPATKWLDQHQRVEQISWVPGKDEIVKDKLIADGGWIERPGVSIFNLYRPPIIVTAGLNLTAADVEPWLNHTKTIYPSDWEHIVKWLAQRVQRPEEKINHCLLLGGSQGIGKDTVLEPVKHAVGPWNFQEINPVAMLGRFNGFLRSVILRISEARDLGEVNRFAFYDHLKTIAAAPPDVLRVDEKNLREYYVFNVCGVIITTNHKTGGVYLPPDDRRTYVAWSSVEKEAFDDGYWKRLWGWYAEQDGIRKVAAFLTTYDLSAFNPKAPPPRTPAFYEIVATGIAPEEVELTDLIERMGSPDALTLGQLSDKASLECDLMEFAQWIDDRDNRRAIPHKLEQCGYIRVPNPDNKQGVWTVKSWRWEPTSKGNSIVIITRKQAVYAKASLPYAEQIKAVRVMIKRCDEAAEKAAYEAKAKSRATGGWKSV